MSDFKVGDEVLIFRHVRTRYNQAPAEGHTAKVTKVARKYATAAWEVQRPGADPVTATVEFDMETGNERGYERFGYYVRTPEQLERDERRKEAKYVLSEAGIEFKFGRERNLTLEQIEALAEVVKTWED